MSEQRKLGRLVERERDSEARELVQHSPLRVLIALAWLFVIGVTVGLLWASGWLPAQLVPRKLIVRGCELSQAADVVDALAFTGSENYLTLWRRARQFHSQGQRWIIAVSLRPTIDRAALISVSERWPLLVVEHASGEYWLCEDGGLVPVDPTLDVSPAFGEVRANPHVRLLGELGEAGLADPQSMLLAAACCQEVMPGVIKVIESGGENGIVLYDKHAFPIHLGGAQDLRLKIAALPNALRVCAPDRPALRYLDATDARVFYEKWKSPISKSIAEQKQGAKDSG